MTTSDEIQALKARLKATWMLGDFGQIARHSEKAAQDFVDRRRITPGLRVLDVACGTGNVSLPAAQAGATVTGSDIAPSLLEQARARAEAAGLQIKFEEGDAEALPYPDEAFDLVVTQFGAMFAPRPELAARELIRVCRPGGQIAMASWTPSGFIGQLFKATAKYLPPSPLPPPVLWGDEATVRSRLSAGISEVTILRAVADLHYPFGVKETVEFYRLYYGPTQRAFAGLDEAGQASLRKDLEALWSERNVATDGTTRVEAEYLDVTAIRA